MKKTAIITGASSGMGREAAIQISERYRGLDEIWLIARREDCLKKTADKLKTPSRILTYDLADDGFEAQFCALLAGEKPDVKILVNAAGFGKTGNVDETATADASGMIKVNCEALTFITLSVLPYMSDKSRIIMFASAAAFLPQPGSAVYAATKSYVYSFSRALDEELSSRHISVCAVCPGPVDTEFFEVAGMVSPFKKIFMADPEKVVRKALNDSAAARSVSVYGLPMKLARLFCRLLPDGCLIKLMKSIYDKGKDEK